MAREVQIITWCDFCLAEDERRTEAAEHAGLSSSGTRVIVDLCEEHAESHIAPALSVFDAYGRTETKAKAPRAQRKVTAAPGACPECDREFSSAQSLGMHRWRKHGIPSVHKNRKKSVS